MTLVGEKSDMTSICNFNKRVANNDNFFVPRRNDQSLT